MFIAFEGPDNTGKSTSAANLSHDKVARYNATKDMHDSMQKDIANEQDLVVAYDRIDWFSHMVYRLALPGHEWNDARPRTVFSMPDTHLVVKIHHPALAGLISDELYTTGALAEVNPVYQSFAEFFMNLNRSRGYSMFKTVSIMEIANDPTDGSFYQRLVSFDSPVFQYGSVAERMVTNDETLLDLLRYEEQRRV